MAVAGFSYAHIIGNNKQYSTTQYHSRFVHTLSTNLYSFSSTPFSSFEAYSRGKFRGFCVCASQFSALMSLSLLRYSEYP